MQRIKGGRRTAPACRPGEHARLPREQPLSPGTWCVCRWRSANCWAWCGGGARDGADRNAAQSRFRCSRNCRRWTRRGGTRHRRTIQRGLGEVALAACCRRSCASSMRRPARACGAAPHKDGARRSMPRRHAAAAQEPEQAGAGSSSRGQRPALLLRRHRQQQDRGSTCAVPRLLAREPRPPALVLVPEINLTPQLVARFAKRFCRAGAWWRLHSGVDAGAAPAGWRTWAMPTWCWARGWRCSPAAAPGAGGGRRRARPVYKQQEGALLGARPRRRVGLEGARCCWARPRRRSRLAQRPASEGRAPASRWPRASAAHDAARAPGRHREPAQDHSPAAKRSRAAGCDPRAHRARRAELVFLNRRGYARCCTAPIAGWKSDCPHCSAWRVFHKGTARCAATTAASPSACRAPARTAATSTSRRSAAAPKARGATGLAGAAAGAARRCRSGRIDADSTRLRGSLEPSWPQCMPARSTCWWARRWWPRATTSGASRWWRRSIQMALFSQPTSAPASACSRC